MTISIMFNQQMQKVFFNTYLYNSNMFRYLSYIISCSYAIVTRKLNVIDYYRCYKLKY